MEFGTGLCSVKVRAACEKWTKLHFDKDCHHLSPIHIPVLKSKDKTRPLC